MCVKCFEQFLDVGLNVVEDDITQLRFESLYLGPRQLVKPDGEEVDLIRVFRFMTTIVALVVPVCMCINRVNANIIF